MNVRPAEYRSEGETGALVTDKRIELNAFAPIAIIGVSIHIHLIWQPLFGFFIINSFVYQCSIIPDENYAR
jgi:hypothetical protein